MGREVIPHHPVFLHIKSQREYFRDSDWGCSYKAGGEKPGLLEDSGHAPPSPMLQHSCSFLPACETLLTFLSLDCFRRGRPLQLRNRYSIEEEKGAGDPEG